MAQPPDRGLSSAVRQAARASTPAMRFAKKLGAEAKWPLHDYLRVSDDPAGLAYLLSLPDQDVNLLDQDGVRPLHVACEESRNELVPLLLGAGAEPDHRALWRAIEQGSPETVKALVAAGAEVAAHNLEAACDALRDTSNKTPARRQAIFAKLATLLGAADKDVIDTALMHNIAWALSADTEAVGRLLAARGGPDPGLFAQAARLTRRRAELIMPGPRLHIAAIVDHWGIDPDNVMGYVATMYAHPQEGAGRAASSRERRALLGDLLARGAAAPAGLLADMCRSGNTAAADIALMARHAAWQINEPDGDGRYPLHLLVTSGCSRRTLQTLLNAGADPNLVDVDGYRALDRLEAFPSPDTRNGQARDMLEEYGAQRANESCAPDPARTPAGA